MPKTLRELTAKEKAWARKFYDKTCFEMMYLDEVRAGTRTFEEAWAANVRWLRDMVDETDRMIGDFPEQ